MTASESLLEHVGYTRFRTVLADPPWRFPNRSGETAPNASRRWRKDTLSFDEIKSLPVSQIVEPDASAHLYLWTPNHMLPRGLEVMAAWGFEYKTNLIWHKVTKDGKSDGRELGFYFRNATETVLFGVRGKKPRTREAGRRQVNLIPARKRKDTGRPEEIYPIIEACSHWPYAELFARDERLGWFAWGDEIHSGSYYGIHVGECERYRNFVKGIEGGSENIPIYLGSHHIGDIEELPDGVLQGHFFTSNYEEWETFRSRSLHELTRKMAYA